MMTFNRHGLVWKVLCFVLLLGAGFVALMSAHPVWASGPGSVNPPGGGSSECRITTHLSVSDNVCISKSGSAMVASASLLSQVHSGWRACSIQVNLYDSTFGSNVASVWLNCGTEPHGSYSEPAIAFSAGHEYFAWTDWKVANLGGQFEYNDYSPGFNA